MKKGELLSKAILFATRAHAGQPDKSGEPYILHPLAVMGLLPPGSDEEVRCIAILHDAVEDGKIDGERVTYDMLEAEGFTPRIIHGVAGLTKNPGESPDQYKRKVMETVDRMIVKQADLTHNSKLDRLKGVTPKDLERTARYQQFYWEITQKLKELEAQRKPYIKCGCFGDNRNLNEQ